MTLGEPMATQHNDETRATRVMQPVSELFHRINRVLPQNQRLLVVPPEMTSRDAIALLRQHEYSQVPVVVEGQVLGVFSHRSFAQRVADCTAQEITKDQCAPGDWPVEECLERFEYARVSQEMQQVFDAMNRDNGVLVGTPDRLLGILTPMDVLRYLYGVACPYVMISEIELTLRALISSVVSQAELEECARRSLSKLYNDEGRLPLKLEQMTFGDYTSIITNGMNWPAFEPIFGGSRVRTASKLKTIGDLRNDLFHLKREITVEDHETLSDLRNWLLQKAIKVDARHRQRVQP